MGYWAIVVTILALVSVAFNPDVPFRNQDGRLREGRSRVDDIAFQPNNPLDGNLVRINWVSEEQISVAVMGHTACRRRVVKPYLKVTTMPRSKFRCA